MGRHIKIIQAVRIKENNAERQNLTGRVTGVSRENSNKAKQTRKLAPNPGGWKWGMGTGFCLESIAPWGWPWQWRPLMQYCRWHLQVEWVAART